MSPQTWRRTVWLLMALVTGLSLVAVRTAQPTGDLLATADPLGGLAASQPILIRPRMLASYGALLAAATLIILYLYRGRAFIVYWIGSWLLLAGALGLVSRQDSDPQLSGVLLGLALLLIVWSAGLLLLAAKAFPASPLRWTVPIRCAALSAVWFLSTPFLIRSDVLLATGTMVAAVLLGWSAARYLRLGQQTGYAGAFVIGGGLAIVCAASVVLSVIVLNLVRSSEVVNTLAVLNVVTSVFVWLGMPLVVFEDVANELRRTNRDLAQANEEVKRLAITDPLTGCHNRRFFDEIERREMVRHRRYGTPLSVVFVDVDHFKLLNDTLGHDTGDRVLRTIGTLLRRHVRQSDYVIRWGGDEFLLLLTCGVAEAEAKAAELKAVFSRERTADALPHYVGLSLGVAAASKDAETLADTIRIADARMYRDKLTERSIAEPPGA